MKTAMENVSCDVSILDFCSGTNKYLLATYFDFADAALVKWIEASCSDKAKKLMNLYGDDTFTKLMKKVSVYSS